MRLIRYGLLMSKEPQSFGEFLAERIRMYYDSDVDFAAAAGIKSSSSISRYVNGGIIPKVATLEQMAPALRMSARALIARAYPVTGSTIDGEPEPAATPAPPAFHPLALELDRLLRPESRVPDDKRASLTALVDSLIDPYRRYLRSGRKTV